MKDRKRHKIEHAEPEAQSPEPPAPETQGDGEAAAPPASSGDGQGNGAPSRESQGAVADPPSVRTEQTPDLNEQLDKYLRLAAEYDNYRRRTAKERAEAASRGQAELVGKLVDALDDLSRFADIDPATTDPMTLHKGIELVEQKMLKTLGAAGLEVLNPIDQTFDPTMHEAVATEPALSAEDDDTVGKVFQQGYRFNGQLLRPARVVVKQWNG
jgi:molecular chaperone GrpE